MQRYVTQVKSDIHREMELAELGKVKREFESAAHSFESEVRSQANEAESEIRDLQASIDRDLDEAVVAPPKPQAPPPSPQLELGIDHPADSQPSRRESSG
jgi:sec-independent protein translocase protein TatB